VGSIPTTSSRVKKPAKFDCHRFFVAQNPLASGQQTIKLKSSSFNT